MDVEIKSLLLGLCGAKDENSAADEHGENNTAAWSQEIELISGPPEARTAGFVYPAAGFVYPAAGFVYPAAGTPPASLEPERFTAETLLQIAAAPAAEPEKSAAPVYSAGHDPIPGPGVRYDEKTGSPETFSGSGGEGINELLQQLLQTAERTAEAAEICAGSLERRETESHIVYQ